MKRLRTSLCTWLIVGLSLSVLSVGCRKKPEPSETPETPGAQVAPRHADEKKHADIPRLIQLTPEVTTNAKITVQPAEKRRLAATVDLNGQVVADPDHIAELGARAAGRVVKVLVREGDTVRAGQTLAVVTSSELAKQRATYAAVSAKAVAARKNAARLRSLVSQRLGADQDAVTAEAEAAALEAERDAAAQLIHAMGAPLTTSGEGDASLLVLSSPISGQVIQRDAVPGQMVEPSRTLITVADLSKIWFQAQLFEKDLAQVAEGAAAEVRLNGYPNKVWKAQVVRVASQVDPQSRTLAARMAVEDPDQKMRLGLFGKARVSVVTDQAGKPPGEEGAETVVVPLSAVTDVGERKVVFVRQPDGDYELHEVTLGQSAGSFVPVLSGLRAGEQVVVSGVHTLRSVVLRATMKEED